MNASFADNTIKPPKGMWEIVHKNGSTQDIINTILMADKESKDDTKFFANAFTSGNLKALWQFVRNHIKYKEDPNGDERVMSPAATWKKGKADCKSMSIFIASVLKNMGIPYKYRFVAWTAGNVSHVYPVALVGNKEIILDAVHKKFNEEVPFHHGYDYTPQASGEYEVSKISGLNPTSSQGIVGLALIAFIAYKIMS